MTHPMERIVERESQMIERATEDLLGELISASDVLSALCVILNLRQRYFGQAGEYGSVVQLDGINTVDALDEVLVRQLNLMLATFWQDARPELDAGDFSLIHRACSYVDELPEHPVGYMVIHVLRRAFQTLEPIAEQVDAERRNHIEIAFVKLLLDLTGRYVASRTDKGARHFSDIAREYSVVARMTCDCGEAQFQVQKQALTEVDGVHHDRLHICCLNCGEERELDFPLPHFGDLSGLE